MTQTTAPLTPDTAHRAFELCCAGWERGDPSWLDQLCAADLVYHLPPFPDLDRAGVRQFTAGFHQAFPDLTIAEEETVVGGGTSVHRWRCEATYQGDTDLFPVPPTGRRTHATGALVLHWSGDRVSEVWHFGDWMGFLTEAGVIPPLQG